MSDSSSNANKAFAASSAADPGLMGDEQLQSLHEQLLHEKEEPDEGFSLLPIFLIFLLAGLIFWSGLYVLNHAAAFQWNVYDDNWRAGAAEAEDPAVAQMKRGAAIFQASCKQCHGVDAQGQPGLYPPLAGSPWPVGDPRRPISILLEGMTGTVTVLGNTVNGSMPAVAGHLAMKDSDVAAVLTYVRANFGNNALPVDVSVVTDVRNDLGTRTAVWSPDEILAKYPLGLPDPAAAAAAAPAGPAGTAPAAGTAAPAGTAASAGTATSAGTAPMAGTAVAAGTATTAK